MRQDTYDFDCLNIYQLYQDMKYSKSIMLSSILTFLFAFECLYPFLCSLLSSLELDWFHVEMESTSRWKRESRGSWGLDADAAAEEKPFGGNMHLNFAHCDACQFLISFGALRRFGTAMACRYSQYSHYDGVHLAVNTNPDFDFRQRWNRSFSFKLIAAMAERSSTSRTPSRWAIS